MKLFGVLCFLGLCGVLFLVFPPLGLGLLVIGVVVKVLMR
jgi:hypothetical protein